MKLTAKIRKLLETFEKSSYKIEAPKNILDRPIYGTTLYLATCELEMIYGKFTAHVFQDIVHKGYIIALAHGEVKKAKVLHTRIHSSCITSETLRGCDCDCVEQLEGALKMIAKKGAGILFYLMQEGRGVGYIAKARDRMLVQASNDAISTFEAYRMIGLKRDYRQYRNVVPICKMLQVKAGFVVMTNNPDKVKALTEMGFKITETASLEYEPSPYNLAYLKSKQESGHILEKPQFKNLKEIHTPETVIPFKPHALKNAQRFIKVASYFLPIRPVDNEIIISDKEYKKIFSGRPIGHYLQGRSKIFKNHTPLRKNRHKIALHITNFRKYRKNNPDDPISELLFHPYWFRVHLYADIVTDEDFVVLTHGDAKKDDTPFVRIQSESLFNRFPLKETENKDRFRDSLKKIMEYGVGVILQLHSDGRGAGLGAFSQDMMLTQQGHSADTMESYNKLLGINYDLRDYEAAMILLKEHLPSNAVQMVMNSPSSLVLKTNYTEALNKLNINVKNWIFIEDPNDK